MSAVLDPESREKWPSRLSFVLASMGGAVGIGNLLRYPSIAARNYGLQWFIPYLLALFLIGMPILALEISLGQSMRGAAVVAHNAVHRRLRGLGTATALIALITVTYYVVIMAWVLAFLRHSFRRPLPWLLDPKFFSNQVVRNVQALKSAPGEFLSYPGHGVVGETLGWSVLTWVIVYFCIFRGVALTGRIVYVTMLVPLALCFALLVRSVTLPRARDGIRLYVGIWRSDVIASGEVWRDAIIQIFFSIGTGFGYFMAYSSYNAIHANAVQDVLIIALSNSLIEVIIGFAAFAVVGFLNIDLNKEDIGSFGLGFITYPAALGRIPGSNAWSFFFFLTVYLLAVDSAFALLESFISCATDSDWGRRLPKPVIVGIISVIAMCLSFMYSSKFGSNLLDAMDFWVTGVTLSFVTWFQCIAVTGMYRYKDVIAQTDKFAFIVAQTAYIGSMASGVTVGRFAGFWWGVLTFAGILIVGTILATSISKVPEVIGVFGSGTFLNKLWWLTSYSGHQLMRDLNAVVGRGDNWKLPFFWAPLLRWVSAPVLISILAISYKGWREKDRFLDPLHCFAFTVAHVGIVLVVLGFLWPPSLAFLIPNRECEADQRQYSTSPGETLLVEDEEVVTQVTAAEMGVVAELQ